MRRGAWRLAVGVGLWGMTGCPAPQGVSPCATLATTQCTAPAGLEACSNLQGSYRAIHLRAVQLDGSGVEAFANADLSVTLSGDTFQSTFLAPGEPVLERSGRLYTRDERLELGDQPLLVRTSPGLQSFRCGRGADGTLYLRTDALGFDFDRNGSFERALLEVNLAPAQP